MPAAVSPTVRPTVEHDDLDDIFNYDAGIDATFNQEGTNRFTPDLQDVIQSTRQAPEQAADIDEEVKVTKKRRPVAKLDEDRLLSQQGIPKLRKIAKDRIRINGKGHEFTDMARLLNTYQLWLDDLFPKAKFMDGVSMIEKLGHKKRIQMMRREWIDEGKPKPPRDEEDDFIIQDEHMASNGQNSPTSGDQSAARVEQQQDPQSNTGAANETGQRGVDGEEEPDDDELDALLMEGAETMSALKTNNKKPTQEEEPDEDELDALMAEDQEQSHPKSLFGGPMPSASNTAPKDADAFDDDEEAMAGMDW